MSARFVLPKARGMLRKLSAAACVNRLTSRLASREAELVISIQRQATRPRWRPSPRQATVIRRLYAAMAEAEATLIDEGDTGDARPAEFVFDGGKP